MKLRIRSVAAMAGVFVLTLICSADPSFGAELRIGTATGNITPDQAVALQGQRRTRIAREVESPLVATVVAVEAVEDGKAVDSAIFVSCDLCKIDKGLSAAVRERVAERLQDLNTDKICMSATHTHTGPVMVEGLYDIPEEGVMQPTEYVEFAAERISEAIVEAWESRGPGGVSWGLGHAVVAHNRRAVYADGKANLYGSTSRPDFRHIEGYEDHGVEVLFFWDGKNQLQAVAVNVACPSQEVESRSKINADYWHQVREGLRERYGEDLCVLGWCGAAGDQSPHLMFRKRAERRMQEGRGLTRLEEIARRIVEAVDEAHEVARGDIRADVEFAHKVKQIELPRRSIPEDRYIAAKEELAELKKKGASGLERWWREKLIKRYENGEPYSMDMHALRLGDVAVCTNDFELFTDFGVQMKSRSPALQTFVIQLAGPGGYVPTPRALEQGHYGTGVLEAVLSPEGGQKLTDHTVETIKSMW